MSTINTNEFQQALDRLEAVTKSGATQLHHTPNDSDPSTHAGTATNDYQDEHNDGIDDNGMDYTGVKKALATKVAKAQSLTPAEIALTRGQNPRNLIADKIAKGQSLTAAESWAISPSGTAALSKATTPEYAGMEKGADKPGKAGTPGETGSATMVPDSHGGESEQDEIEADAKKSLQAGISQTQELRKGIEVSRVLYELTQAIGHALQGSESRVVKSLQNTLNNLNQRLNNVEATMQKSFGAQNEYNKGLAEAVVGIGQHVAGHSAVAQAQATMPVSGPRAATPQVAGNGQQYVEKSFGPGGLPVGEQQFTKSQIVNAMVELVKSNQLQPASVIKYEGSGQISQKDKQLVNAYIQKQIN